MRAKRKGDLAKESTAAKPAGKPVRKFREQTSNFLIIDDQDAPNHAPKVEGTLVEKGSQQFSNGTVGRYKLQHDDGSMSTILGATTMDDKLSIVPEGAYVRIEYVETVKANSGRPVKQFKVEVAE